ncbi:MAG: hypothetical protein HN380_21915, partial [Victivallales bacterium]|nr:hypothetical protein [Victivallales bacterium]
PGASSALVIAQILARQGIDSMLMPATQLAAPEELQVTAYDLLVLPDSPVFPAPARANVIRFLRTGGSLVALGGYPFERMLVPVGEKWVPQEDAHARRVELALSARHSLLVDGGFEKGSFGEGWQAGSQCRVVKEEAPAGAWCVRTELAPDGPKEAVFRAGVPAKGRARYAAVASLRTRGIRARRGTGYAFVAVYQYDADGKLAAFRDFATQTGDAPWQKRSHVFETEPETVRIEMKAGIYNATGTAWIDDIRLVPYAIPEPQPLNTASGVPEDGLVTTPEQIGLCDASFPFRRAVGVRSVEDGRAVLAGSVEGWPVTAVIGNNNARWMPILEGHDRYDRPTGAALSLVQHYNGVYRGSAWLACGVTNRDLFSSANTPASRVLGKAVKRLLRRCFLHQLRVSPRHLAPGEKAQLSVQIANYGAERGKAQIRLLVNGKAVRVVDSMAAAYADTEVASELALTDRGLVRVVAELLVDGQVLDRMETGVVIAKAMPKAPEARFQDNAFTLGGRPMFLFGTDSYAYTYFSAHESPVTWSRDHAVGRDFGLNLYENLQFSRGPGYEPSDADWRDFRAMAWLTQQNRLVFMPGMLIGQDVAADDAMLARQSRLCANYAKHFQDVPGLHLYLNGDYKNRAWQGGDHIEELWNRWLRDAYGDLTRLREAWGEYAPRNLAWPVAYPKERAPEWGNPVAVSRARFHIWLTQRWNRSHAAAIREHDQVHPLMSEYYRLPLDGIDLPLTLDDLDVSDIGYFNPPDHDLETLPLAIRWSDQRLRGKGVCLGEYGVKTHPAWLRERGGRGYHVARTDGEQAQLAVAVAHYGLGMGASKVQNWCLRDSQTRVFPWGLFYPNAPLPKPWAYVHRNLSLVWRHFTLAPEQPTLAVCVPTAIRIGNHHRIGFDAPQQAFASLLDIHADFATIQDANLDDLPATVRTLVYPAAMAVADADFAELTKWVRGGGNLLVSGSLAYDGHRRGERHGRLLELCGVSVERQRFPHVERSAGEPVRVAADAPVLAGAELRPAVDVSLAGAKGLVLSVAGKPLVTEFALGKGRVVWCADPLSLADETAVLRRQLHGWFLARVGEPTLTPRRIDADGAVHVFRRRLRTGEVRIAFATRGNSRRARVEFGAGDAAVGMDPGWPGLVARSKEQVVALGGVGELCAFGRPILTTDRHVLMLSLDGTSLNESPPRLVLPLQGACTLRTMPATRPEVAIVGEFRSGTWTELERLDLPAGSSELVLDADRATCVVLICRPEQAARWGQYLGEALTRPEQLTGY